MVDKVEIAQGEENPSVEEQAQQQEQNSQSTPEAQPTETSSERPEWLPEKFSNAEELAKPMVNLKRNV